MFCGRNGNFKKTNIQEEEVECKHYCTLLGESLTSVNCLRNLYAFTNGRKQAWNFTRVLHAQNFAWSFTAYI